MSFLKENSYDIVKLYINQIGIAIFSFVLYTAVGGMSSDSVIRGLNVGLSVFSVLFYFALIYTATWEYGAKDKVRIDSGKMNYDKLKGIKLALCASVPNSLISGLCAIFAAVFSNTGAKAFGVIATLLNSFMRITMSMYMGIINAIFGSFVESESPVADPVFIYHALAFLSTALLLIAVSQLGYIFGVKNFRIFSSLDKNKKK